MPRPNAAECRALGRCIRCTSPSSGFAQCDNCRARNRAQAAKHVAERIAEGICIDCKERALEGHRRCGKHLASESATVRRLRRDRKAAGVCVQCGGKRDRAALICSTCKP